MTLMEKLAEAKSNLAEVKEAVENGEKGAEELSEAIEGVKSAQAKVDAAEEAEALMKKLGTAEETIQPAEKEATMPAKTLGEHFVKFREEHPDIDNRIAATPFKAAGDPTLSTNLVPTQYEPEPVRRIAAPLSVLDLFAKKTITAPIYSWNVAGSTTGSVSTTAEGDTKNKLTYAYTPKTATLLKITGLIKMSEELFEDNQYLADAINQDLVDDLNAGRQSQAVATLLATSGLLTDSVSYSTAVDIFKGILDAAADVEDATHIPCDAVVVTPAIWKLLRAATDNDGQFYAGNPFSESEYAKLFDMTFVKSADVTANHIIVGAFARGAELVSKADGVRVDSTNSNDVDFEKNLVSVRAEAREVLAVKRPACFCNITLSAATA